MQTRIRLDFETILSIRNAYRAINKMDINMVDFYNEGKLVDIPQVDIDEWDFTGLGLIDFVEEITNKDGNSSMRHIQFETVE